MPENIRASRNAPVLLRDCACQTKMVVDKMVLTPSRREYILNKVQPILNELTELCIHQTPNDPALCIATHLVETRNLRVAADYELASMKRAMDRRNELPYADFMDQGVQTQHREDIDDMEPADYTKVYQRFIDEGLSFITEDAFKELVVQKKYLGGGKITENGIYVLELGTVDCLGEFLRPAQCFLLDTGEATVIRNASMAFIPLNKVQELLYDHVVIEFKTVPLFSDLSEDQLKQLADSLKPLKLGKGFHGIDSFFILEKGECEIDGQLLPSFAVCGEEFLLGSSTKIPVKVVTEQAVLLLLDKGDFKAIKYQ
jgi:hypothetical protein